ncbi:unnamed protein product, partial [Allacma fusca]
ISKEEEEVGNKFRCNGYSEEFLDRIEPNGNILRAKQHSSTSDALIEMYNRDSNRSSSRGDGVCAEDETNSLTLTQC